MADEFIALIQAKLDTNQLESEISNLKPSTKIKVDVDTSYIKKQLESALSGISTKNVQSQTRQIGQNIGQQIQQGVKSGVDNSKRQLQDLLQSFENVKLSGLNTKFNLTGKGIDANVSKQVNQITKELNALSQQIITTNSDDAWSQFINKINILTDIVTKFGSVKADLSQFESLKSIVDYFSGTKIFVPSDIKSDFLSNAGFDNLKQINDALRGLEISFTNFKEKGIELNSVWEEFVSTSNRHDLGSITNQSDQMSKLVDELLAAKSKLYGDESWIPISESGDNSSIKQILLNYIDAVEQLAEKSKNLRDEQAQTEQQIANVSTATANTIVQNEEKKQQAYQTTAQAHKQIEESESLVKNSYNVTTFDNTKNAAKEARDYFADLLESENAVIAVNERFGENNNLTSFSLNIKRATGEVETLRYALENLGDNENPIYAFVNKGAEINNSEAIKQTASIENAFADYTQKLAQFKSTNTNILSGLTDPLKDFETKLAGLKSGAVTIDEVKNSFKSLGTEASNITANFSGQLSKTDAAIRNIAKGKETIKGLSAEIKGLNNIPNDAQSQLKNVSSLLNEVNNIEASEGRTSNWSAKYREYEDALNSLIAKVKVWKKEEANSVTTQIFNTSDLKAANIPYMTKVSNTIEKQMAEIQKMANAKGWSDFKVTGLEEANGKIKNIKLNVTESTGAIKELNFEVAKLNTGKRTQNGLIQTGDIKIIKTATQAQQEYNEEQQKLAESFDSGKYQADLKKMSSAINPFEDMDFDSVKNAKEYLNEYESALVAIQDHFDGKNILSTDELVSNFEKLNISAEKFRNSMTEVKVDTQAVKSLSDAVTKYSDLSDKLNSINNYDLSKFDGSNGAIKLSDNLEKAKEAKSRLDAEMAKGNDANIDNINADLKVMQSELKKADTQWDKLNASVNQLDNIKAGNSTLSWLNNNTKAAKEYGETLTKLAELQKNAQTVGERESYTKQAQAIISEATEKGLTGNSILNELQRAFKQIGQFTGIYELTSQLQQIPKQMVSAVYEVDTAMTNLYKVTDETSSKYNEFLDNAGTKAQELGRDMSSFITQTSEWAKLGFSFDEATSLSEISSIYANVGEVDDSTAVSDLVTAMKAFNIEASDSMSIIDSLNKLGNEFATSSADLGEGLSNAASSLSVAGNDINQSLAMITGMAEIIQDASEAGNALKILSMRVRGI